MSETTEARRMAEVGIGRKVLHYHIRWSGKETLDWEGFETFSMADESARQLVKPGETYAIEEHGETCPRCSQQAAIPALP